MELRSSGRHASPGAHFERSRRGGCEPGVQVARKGDLHRRGQRSWPPVERPGNPGRSTVPDARGSDQRPPPNGGAGRASPWRRCPASSKFTCVATIGFAGRAGVADRVGELHQPPHLYSRALELAGRLRQGAACDAHYLALAETLGCELWTADEKFYRTASPAARGVRRIVERAVHG